MWEASGRPLLAHEDNARRGVGTCSLAIAVRGSIGRCPPPVRPERTFEGRDRRHGLVRRNQRGGVARHRRIGPWT